MKKLFFVFIPLFAAVLLSAYTFKQVYWEDCDGCEYEKTFERTINQGDDSVYKLYCRETGNSYTIYKRGGNGKWERQGSDQQYSECDLVRFMCDCDK